MGITNPQFRDEPCPQGDCAALAFNPAPALNDDGRDVESITNFVAMLAPPARGVITEEARVGEQVFNDIACSSCHRPTIRTGPSAVAGIEPGGVPAVSDFLLHDMGTLGDGIVQGQAAGREIRTAPLWGLRNHQPAVARWPRDDDRAGDRASRRTKRLPPAIDSISSMPSAAARCSRFSVPSNAFPRGRLGLLPQITRSELYCVSHCAAVLRFLSGLPPSVS